ncbi:MAG: hypothetical protein A3I77_08545 [Gammaproteobacteria bacterium RIFCSPLOWO2_02_FULL_42_14]|nr:MAG: hypothetical protein A3B71_07170 [Gammaproteobacteria bacterium RIFCSPHIGHO2_02_FULL_42_43]OGT53621.1 MAG: hypothetical protein A3E54_02750 [Gammaproteobacteria bacterium RIFCSPHIGHO2_12_FULL_41_25]OGT61672.1 MAG: hypothetical protein A3I77_08545 [Gammaproteobacteria bacterium RIFCSPLOWO2_02_FULL_42_14]OGT85431.1 MAG: hypothetical protein A3G86_08255 [Gammaproteobacteria bacterium RIFCSPLOWO2_12_FULL_42_18]
MIKRAVFVLLPFVTFISALASETPTPQYTDDNQANVAFDISMPIDATGYILHGKNLTGGNTQFTDQGIFVAPFLAHETGEFESPVSTDLNNNPLIKTTIRYNTIKLITPIGINNFFIKIGVAARTQTMSGLDPFVIPKSGTYTWEVPFFSVGTESDTVDNKSSNHQFIEVGSGSGPAHHNSMYTQQFYLYSKADGNTAITGHPEKTSTDNETLAKTVTASFTCKAEGIWGAGGSDPYRTIIGDCHGSTMTFPAGPNLDYEYGTFKLPTIKTPWDATPNDHCLINGKPKAGCTTASIASKFHYMAQKIRVPINNNITVYAEFGTAYRSITPDNLRYECKSNVYIKNLLPLSDCHKKSYFPGGSDYPYFAVGYEFKDKNDIQYSARYIFIPEQENANRLAWRDAASTRIYAISVSNNRKTKPTATAIKKNFNDALNVIGKIPAVYDVLGKHFFVDVLKKNNLYEQPKNK